MIGTGWTIQDYARRFEMLNSLDNHVKWRRGEILLECERDFGHESWSSFADGPNAPSEWVLRQEIRAARAYPEDARVPGLSWSHHFHALRIESGEGRQQVLEKAAEREMSANEIHAEVSEIKRRQDNTEDADPWKLERMEYILARIREMFDRPIDDLTVSGVLQAAHEWDTARSAREPPTEQGEALEAA